MPDYDEMPGWFVAYLLRLTNLEANQLWPWLANNPRAAQDMVQVLAQAHPELIPQPQNPENENEQGN